MQQIARGLHVQDMNTGKGHRRCLRSPVVSGSEGRPSNLSASDDPSLDVFQRSEAVATLGSTGLCSAQIGRDLIKQDRQFSFGQPVQLGACDDSAHFFLLVCETATIAAFLAASGLHSAEGETSSCGWHRSRPQRQWRSFTLAGHIPPVRYRTGESRDGVCLHQKRRRNCSIHCCTEVKDRRVKLWRLLIKNGSCRS